MSKQSPDCSPILAAPRMIGLAQAALDPVRPTDHVKAQLRGIDGIPVPGLVGRLDALLGQDRADAIGCHLQQMRQELPRRPPVGPSDGLSTPKLLVQSMATKR